MSEEKIIKHSEKAIKTITNRQLGWKGKLKELIQEVLIIVFAVSITLALHNWNDHRKERILEKEFLIGIRNDLRDEKKNLTDGINSFQPTMNFYDSVLTQIIQKRINPVYIDTNGGYLLNTMYFIFDKGRFEGFKSSGYLRLIENQSLQKRLISLYTSYMPFEEDADKNVFRTREQDYITYIGNKAPFDSAGMHISAIINDPAVKYQILRYGSYFKERKEHKQNLVKEIDSVINLITKELENF
jgi:hypothetical protein